MSRFNKVHPCIYCGRPYSPGHLCPVDKYLQTVERLRKRYTKNGGLVFQIGLRPQVQSIREFSI